MDRFVVTCEFVVCVGRECAPKRPRILSIGKTSCVCFTRVTKLILLARSAWTAMKEEGMGRAGWLGSTPRQRLDDALGWHGAHEAVREARRSYSIRSELQDTRSVSSWFFSSVQAASDR